MTYLLALLILRFAGSFLKEGGGQKTWGAACRALLYILVFFSWLELKRLVVSVCFLGLHLQPQQHNCRLLVLLH